MKKIQKTINQNQYVNEFIKKNNKEKKVNTKNINDLRNIILFLLIVYFIKLFI